MRTIKFRAFWKEAKLMANVEMLRSDGSIEFFVPVESGNKEWEQLQVLDESEQYELMQFTGLLDKNGKEIYEGDIIKHSDYGQISIIEWDERSAGWMATSVSNWNPKTNFNSQNDEVVGNKFENPELLVTETK